MESDASCVKKARVRRMWRWYLASLVMGVVLLCPLNAAAASTDVFVPTLAGECVFPSLGGPGLTLSATPPIQLTSSSVNLTVAGSGTCVGNAGANVVSLSISGSLNMSCAGGTGTLFGSLSWSTGLPNAQPAASATIVAGPGTATMVVTGNAFNAVVVLGWSNPAALIACPSPGTSSTGLTGGMTYVSQS